MKDQCVAEGFHAVQSELRDHIKLVLDFNLQALMGKDLRSMLKNIRQLPCEKPVADVVVNPRLQETGFLKPFRPTAVNEPLRDMSHLGHVIVRWNLGAIRKTN